MKNPWVALNDLGWISDWGGKEVGYENREVVGLYVLKNTNYAIYIDMNTMEILEIIFMGERELKEE